MYTFTDTHTQTLTLSLKQKLVAGKVTSYVEFWKRICKAENIEGQKAMVAWKNSSKAVEGEVVSCCKMTHSMLGLEVNILDTEKEG